MAEGDITAQVVAELQNTPYACTSLTRLSGGTGNFVYRGTLVPPLRDGSETVVVKHTEDFVASNVEFKITPERAVGQDLGFSAAGRFVQLLPLSRALQPSGRTFLVSQVEVPYKTLSFDVEEFEQGLQASCLSSNDFEAHVLSSLSTFLPSTHQGITITTPTLLHFSPEEHTQIQSDLPSSSDLKTYALTQPLTQSQSARLGYALGVWTRKFHSWAAAPEQDGLRRKMRENTAMRDLKFMVNYTRLVATVQRFPNILGSSKEIFQAVKEKTQGEIDIEGEMIHGDFWTGNVLLPNAPITAPEEQLKVFVIDWELCQLSSVAFDLGQMFGELFELKHFKDIDAGLWLIDAFIEGYGEINEALAFKTAIHAGAHLVCWGSSVQGWGTQEQIENVVRIGRDWVVNGWEKNTEYFEGTALKKLFT